MKAGGGFKAIQGSLGATYRAGFLKMYRAMSSKNACKSCALGMGGQKGGMRNEDGEFPEVCKKSFLAQQLDLQPGIPESLFAKKSIAEFRTTSPRLLEQTGRLNSPLHKNAGDSHYRPIDWETALEKIAARFKSTSPDRSFFYSSGRSSNEAAFLLQIFARLYGTNNINNCSYYCHQASGVGIGGMLGSGTATIQLEDLDDVDLIFVIGANPASNHPRFMRQLLNCRRRGGQVIIINPAKESGLVQFKVPSDIKSMVGGDHNIASEYVQINIGGDVALLKGLARVIIEENKHNRRFINESTDGSEEFIDDIMNTGWDDIVTGSGISKERIWQIGRIYAKSSYAVFAWAMGITHHEHGVENVESIVNLALLRGMLGQHFAGLLPLRGHSNVQGVGSVGVTPALKTKTFENIEKFLNVKLPTTPGMDTMACISAAEKGEIDAAFLLGGNLYGANPDSEFSKRALNNIPFKVFLSTTLNQGHFTGVDQEVLILPVAARDEEPQKTTQESMFNFVRISDGGIVRLDNVRSEVDIIAELATKVLGNKPVDFSRFNSREEIRKTIALTIPGFEKMKTIDQTREEFQISGRTFHTPVFATPTRKASFKVCPLPVLRTDPQVFRMMTIRSEGQFNTIVYSETDLYRGQTERWVVLMNPEDIKQNGLKENERVHLESVTGTMENVKVRAFDIAPGNIATYFPESNVLVPTTTDPRSLTPGYKLVHVSIHKSARTQDDCPGRLAQ